MNRILLGAAGGALLSASRLPAGRTLIELGGVSFAAQSWADAGVMIAFALSVCLARRAFVGHSGLNLLIGAVAGFIAHAAVLHPKAASLGMFAIGAPLILLLLLAFVASRGSQIAGSNSSEKQTRETDDGDSIVATVAVRFGLLLIGAGTALALSVLGRHLQLLSAGEAADQLVFGSLFGAIAIIGAISFGPFLRGGASDAAGPRALALSSLLTAAAAVASLRVLSGLSSSRGLDRFLRRWDMDTSMVGTWSYDLVIAAPVLVVPAFFFGTALYCARRRFDLGAIFVGAALSPLVTAWRLSVEAGTVDLEAHAFSANLLVDACGIASLGVLLATAALRGSLMVRASGAVVALTVGLYTDQLPTLKMPILSPWKITPTVPTLMVDSPLGLATIEGANLGHPQATLDRKELTPSARNTGHDAFRIEQSLRLVGWQEGRRPARVLFIGELTPTRVAALTRSTICPVASVDRTASWYRLSAAFEAELFAAERELAAVSPASALLPPKGELIAPREALLRITSGNYDLVIVPPVQGLTPILPGDIDALSENTIVVAWFDAASGVAQQTLDRVVALAGGVTELSIGLIAAPAALNLPRAGDRESRVTPSGVLLVNADFNYDVPCIVDWLQLKQDARSRRNRTDLAAGLARSNPTGVAADVTRGLAMHFAAQVPSSPYQTPEEGIEFDEEGLGHWQSAALAQEPDAWTIAMWRRIAAVMIAKREIGQIYRLLPPLIERWGFDIWPELQRALAQADLEALEPESAAERLQALVHSAPGDPDLHEMLGRALSGAGDWTAAAQSFRNCIDLAPARGAALERDLAVALLYAGDPEGAVRVQELIEANPDDPSLVELLQAGPPEAPLPNFEPDGEHDHDHEH
ncbi:MAG: hypothetical protein ACI841_001623 [Planctomycetota bacterium]|jgi:hypothetical protein